MWLSRQPFRTFRLRTDAERYIVARDALLPLPFDPATIMLAACADDSYTSATLVDPPRAGWGFTVSRGRIGEEYASDRGPINRADLVELNGAAAASTTSGQSW